MSSVSPHLWNPSQDDDRKQNEYYHLLVEFVYKHVHFHRAELESVLNSYYHEDLQDWLLHDLPNNKTENSHRPFLILSIPNKETYVDSSDVFLNYHNTPSHKTTSTQRTSSVAQLLLTRCILVRSVVELWGSGEYLESCVKSAQHCPYSLHEDASWKVSIHTLGTKFSMTEQAVVRDAFGTTIFQNATGSVQLSQPNQEFVVLREVELDHPSQQPTSTTTHPPATAWYFGRLLCKSRAAPSWVIPTDFGLKHRPYLGPTSMDAELAIIMANLAGCCRTTVVFDPFCGTGSILLACAWQGARVVLGTDIDIRVLRGMSNAHSKQQEQQHNIYSNFSYYQLPRPELIRSDNALYDRHFRHANASPLYDAIVCDPPYGIRAGARQSGTRKRVLKAVDEKHRYNHIAQTKPYAVDSVLADLLNVAAQTLVMGGRLVYIIPSLATDFDIHKDLPRHDCLKLQYVCYQPLSTQDLGRRVVAMIKIAEYDATRRETYLQHTWEDPVAAQTKVARIREQLHLRAKEKPGYEQRIAYRRQRRKDKKIKKRQRSGDKSGNANSRDET